MLLARVTTKKAAVEAALRAYLPKPEYTALLALRGKNLIDPDYDPRGPYGLTPAALDRRGLQTFDQARLAHEKQPGGVHKKAMQPTKPKPDRSKPAGKQVRAKLAVA